MNSLDHGSPDGHPGNLGGRTQDYALAVIVLYSALPRTVVAQVLGRQLLRSGTSVGAQYREATRARSGNEFVAKIEAASQELEESRYWLELLMRADVSSAGEIHPLLAETEEIMRMLQASSLTVKRRRVRS